MDPYKGAVLNGVKGDKLYKNPDLSLLNSGKLSGFYDPRNYYLTLSDIKALKAQGYNENITFEQIQKYFGEKDK